MIKASLPMYAPPELREANQVFWALIRERLRAAGIAAPDMLSSAGDTCFWSDPEMVFSQTCGMPFRTTLHDRVQLVGTPDYGVAGCPPGYYCSVIVARKSSGLADHDGGVLAVNGFDSQSGFAALAEELSDTPLRFSRVEVSGAHLNSARAVAEGRADIAALDAVTWRLIQRYEPWSEDLSEVARTRPTPGLPFVTGLGFDAALVADAVRGAIADLPARSQEQLMLRGLVTIPAEIYQAVPTPASTRVLLREVDEALS